METEEQYAARLEKTKAALRPWLSLGGATRAVLALSAIVFLFSVTPDLQSHLNQPQLAQWLGLNAIGAVLASIAGIFAGLVTAYIGGSIIVFMRRRRNLRDR